MKSEKNLQELFILLAQFEKIAQDLQFHALYCKKRQGALQELLSQSTTN